MAITHIGYKPGGSSAQFKAVRNALLFETLGRRYVVQGFALTNKVHTASAELYTDAMSPKIGQPFFNDSLATIVDVRYTQSAENPFVWDLEVEYDTDRIVSAVTDNPLNQPALITYGSVKYERPLPRDLFGTPVLDSASMPFDPPLTYTQSNRTIRVTRNEASYDSAVALAYEDSLNLLTVNGIPPLCLKLCAVSAQKLITNGVQYYQVTYDLEVKRDTWADYLLDAGFRGWTANWTKAAHPNKPTTFYDPLTSAPLSNVSLLNGRGRQRVDAVTKLTTAMTNDPLNTSLDHPTSDNGLFPPTGTAEALTCDDVFNVKVNDEIMTVVGGYGTGSWTVLRGRQGTIVANHLLDAPVYLEAYYRKFVGFKVLDFSSLSLPSF